MKLEGIHHITAITGDAPGNVDFYARVLGLRLVKQTVNQDDPTVYHLFYADEQGSAGADLTFFEYPGARRGRPGAGMVHRVAWRVGSTGSLDFWVERLTAEGAPVRREGDRVIFADPEGLEHELLVADVPEAPLTARSTEVPAEHALQGFDHVRAYTRDPRASEQLLSEVLQLERSGEDEWEARGERRGGRIVYDTTSERGVPGAGTIHHVAWASTIEDHERWLDTLQEHGVPSTPVVDRFYFRSIYFREPSGVLFELATLGPGFTSDEPLETLGERLSLPPRFEELRDRLAGVLTPLPDTRQWRPRTADATAS